MFTYFSRTLVRPDFAIFFHTSLIIITFLVSSISSKSVSTLKLSTKVIARRSCFRFPFGSHNMRLWASSSL